MLVMKRNFSLADQRVAKVANQTIDVSKFPTTYIMEVVGDNLRPLVGSGATLLFSKVEKPAKGDLVAIYFRPDLPELKQPGAIPMIVKRLTWSSLPPSGRLPYKSKRKSGTPTIFCEGTDPAERLSIPADKLMAVHKCVGIQPQFSSGQSTTAVKARGYLHA
jgi:hypothetical protein